MKKYLTAESVCKGHPDKLCDRISDAVLDAALKMDPDAHVAVETLATDGKIVVAERLIFSNDGLYFYTSDHYASFTELTVDGGTVVWSR